MIYAELVTLPSIFKGTVHINFKKSRKMQNVSRVFGYLTKNWG